MSAAVQPNSSGNAPNCQIADRWLLYLESTNRSTEYGLGPDTHAPNEKPLRERKQSAQALTNSLCPTSEVIVTTLTA